MEEEFVLLSISSHEKAQSSAWGGLTRKYLFDIRTKEHIAPNTRNTQKSLHVSSRICAYVF